MMEQQMKEDYIPKGWAIDFLNDPRAADEGERLYLFYSEEMAELVGAREGATVKLKGGYQEKDRILKAGGRIKNLEIISRENNHHASGNGDWDHKITTEDGMVWQQCVDCDGYIPERFFKSL